MDRTGSFHPKPPVPGYGKTDKQINTVGRFNYHNAPTVSLRTYIGNFCKKKVFLFNVDVQLAKNASICEHELCAIRFPVISPSIFP